MKANAETEEPAFPYIDKRALANNCIFMSSVLIGGYCSLQTPLLSPAQCSTQFSIHYSLLSIITQLMKAK